MPLRRSFAFAFAVPAGVLLIAALARGQMKIGQYEDEAPLRTWNSFPAASAAALGRGSTSLAAGTDGFSIWSNPALLAGLPRPILASAGAVDIAECRRFSLVNTGPVYSDGSLNAAAASLAGLAFALPSKAWTFAAAIGAWESYDRPDIRIESVSAGRTIYRLSYAQSGRLWAGSLAAARRLGPRLRLGLALHVLWGGLERTIDESWPQGGPRIGDAREMSFRGFVPQIGLAWEPGPKWTFGATVRGPWRKASASSSRLEYGLAGSSPDFTIASEEEDRLGQPWVVGLGAAYRVLPPLTLTADAVWLGWSSYAPRLFGEEKDRGFRDVVRLAAGLEYRSTLRLFGRTLDYPLRAGLVYDPQPMRDPRSSYLDLSLGTGLGGKRLRFDLGLLVGRESGSGDRLLARRVVLGLTTLF